MNGCKCPQTCKASSKPHCLMTAGHFVLDSWARFNTFPRAMREGKSGESTQSLYVKSFSLVSYVAILVSIFTQRDDTQKSCVSEYFLSTSPHIPFKYCFPFQTKLNPCMEFKEKFEQVYNTFYCYYLKKLIAAIHCTYKAELQSYFQS